MSPYLRQALRSIRREMSHLIWPQRKDSVSSNQVQAQMDARRYHLLQGCALLGPVESELTILQRKTIQSIFDASFEMWDSGKTSHPAQTQIYEAKKIFTNRVSLAVVMPKYINCDPAFIDHDFAYHVFRSARDAEMDVSFLLQIPLPIMAPIPGIKH